MVYPFIVDKNICNISPNDTSNWIKNFYILLTTVEKASVYIDFDTTDLYDEIQKDLFFIYDIIESNNTEDADILLKQVEELLNILLSQKFKVIHKSLSDMNNYLNELNSIDSKFPSFIISYKKLEPCFENFTNCLDISNHYEQSEIFKKCRDNLYEGNISNLSNGNTVILEQWQPIIKISDKISILDRNVFSKWLNSDNYKKGLKQFADIFFNLNPNIKFEIITEQKNYDSSTDFDSIADDIYTFINTNLPNINVEFIICRSLGEHDRFIMFDEILGAFINRGLDTFIENPDRYRIMYLSINNVLHYFDMAKSTRISNNPKYNRLVKII